MKSPPPKTRSGGGRREWWIGLLGSWMLRLLVATLRIRVENPARLRTMVAEKQYFLVFWHNRLLMVPAVWNKFFSPRYRPLSKAMTSTSRDGELIAQFLGRFGIGAVRGSGTERGSAALRELAGLLKRGHTVAITPDGSRGPLYEIKPGMVLLAQLSGQPILPISFEFSRAWRLKGWDRFFIPKPFSTVTFLIGEPHVVPRTSTPEAFETERQRCQSAVMSLVREP